MKKLLLGLALYAALSGAAFADSLVVQNCGTLPLAYAPGATRLDTVDVNGNKCGLGTVSSYDSGPVTASATPASSSHAAGTSIGGLFSIPLARVAGGSGIITSFSWKSVGGSTGALVIRIWQKNPTSTTCTDNVAFSGSDTDNPNLITPPFSVTPAAPASTTGDSATYASSLGLTLDYKNSDTSPSRNLYVCAVTVATDTADEGAIVRPMLSGPQN